MKSSWLHGFSPSLAQPFWKYWKLWARKGPQFTISSRKDCTDCEDYSVGISDWGLWFTDRTLLPLKTQRICQQSGSPEGQGRVGPKCNRPCQRSLTPDKFR